MTDRPEAAPAAQEPDPEDKTRTARAESAGPTGPAQSTEAAGDPMRDDRTGRSEAGAGFAVGTGLGRPPGAVVGTVAGAVMGATPERDPEPGESDPPAGEPASEGTGPLDPIMRSTMSR